MSEVRLRIRLGQHEFEAEGSLESVDRHLAAFMKLVSPSEAAPPSVVVEQPKEEKAATVSLDRIMSISGRALVLKKPAKREEAVLLMLLGQKEFRQNEVVSGGEIMEGIRESGIKVSRTDLTVNRLVERGDIISIGKHRTRRYRLSSSGLRQALDIARKLEAEQSPPIQDGHERSKRKADRPQQ